MCRRGFTIVEVCVSLALTGLSLAVCAVALAERQQQAATTDNARRLGLTIADFAAYTADHRGYMVNAGLPEDQTAAWFYPPPEAAAGAPFSVNAARYPAQTIEWPFILDRWLGRTEEHWHATEGPWVSKNRPPRPGAIRVGPQPSRFAYSFTMLSKPSMWTWPGRSDMSWEALAPEFEAVRADRIAFPDRKGVLLYDPDDKLTPWVVAFADGSAGERDRERARPAAQPPFRNGIERGRAVLATLDGYLGWDY